MPISARRLRKADHVEGVHFGAPLDCILGLHPLTADLDAEFARRSGRASGLTPNADGSRTIAFDVDPVGALRARRWLVDQLVASIDGLEIEAEDGSRQRATRTPEVLDILAEDHFNEIREAAAEVAGRLTRAVRGN